MTGGDIYLAMCSAAGAVAIVVALWMKHDINKLDREIERLDAEAAARRAARPAE